MNSLRLLLEYKAYPIWIYDEEGLVIDTVVPPEWEDDTELMNALDKIQTIYDSLFLDTRTEFKYIGFNSCVERDAFISLLSNTIPLIYQKNNGKYFIQNDIHFEEI